MNIFITGVCGSVGTALAKLHHSRGDKVYGCSRNETKLVEWADKYDCAEVRVGDAEDLCRFHTWAGGLLERGGVGKVYHCAAMKHVDLCEKDPVTAMRQNFDLTAEIASKCKWFGIPLVFVSTDKACAPSSVYGASKLAAERLVVSLGGAAGRLGNVIGSSGSVFRRWRDVATEGGSVRLTDPGMTRFFMTAGEAALFLADKLCPGKVSVPHYLASVSLGGVAEAFARRYDCKVEVTGKRPGDSKHQQLVSPEEADAKTVWFGNGSPCTKPIDSLNAPVWSVGKLIEEACLSYE